MFLLLYLMCSSTKKFQTYALLYVDRLFVTIRKTDESSHATGIGNDEAEEKVVLVHLLNY